MKFSQFNSIIAFGNQFALFNSLNQKVIFIESELNDLLLIKIPEGIDSLNKIHPTFFSYLLEHEFIVDDCCDETAKVREMCNIIDNKSDNYFLTINPTMDCNFRCWYCYETKIHHSAMSIDILERVKKFIQNILMKSQVKDLGISFFGGEPLLNLEKNVIPIINFAREKCTENGVDLSLGFTTNGFLIDKNFIDYLIENKLSSSFQITIDGCQEDHDKVRFSQEKSGSYTRIIRNVKLLMNHGFNVRLRINYTDKNIDNTHKIAKDFFDIEKDTRDNLLIIDFHRVWQNEKEGDISSTLSEKMKYFQDEGFNVKNNCPNNIFESCYADKRNSAVINYNGDIYKCTARDFTRNNRDGFLNETGELVWENNSLEKRMNIKFKNKSCLNCSIVPLCNGGCSQHAVENEGVAYCINNFDETKKNKIIKSKVEEIYLKNQKNK